MFIKLGDHYSERLATAIILNLPWHLNVIWNFLKHFLAKQTVDKFVFVSGNNTKQKNILNKYINDENLITNYFGKSEYKYDYDTLVKNDEERLKKLKNLKK